MTSLNTRRIVTATVLAVLAIIAVFFLTRGPADFAGPGQGKATVIVARGDSISGIANALTEAEVVASPDAFIQAANDNAKSKSIGPGRYTMLKEMSGTGAVELMLDPKSRADSRLVLPEGLRINQSLEETSSATSIPVGQLNDALQGASELGLPAYANGNAEGFLFPASYDLAGDETADSTLKMLFTRFNQASKDLNLEAAAKALGQSPYNIMKVASLVQAEGHPRDYAKIARVIYNRLKSGMPLQLDTSVAYGLGITEVSLSADQLRSDTPFNTYVNVGLPQTPINSPGEAAIKAALNPAKGPWLYFVTVNLDTGETIFAKNYNKFLKAKAELQNYLKNYG
jgi:UPF0755 protein